LSYFGEFQARDHRVGRHDERTKESADMRCPECLEIDVAICETCGSGIECRCCECADADDDDYELDEPDGGEG
jgi:hypothetical protein